MEQNLPSLITWGFDACRPGHKAREESNKTAGHTNIQMWIPMGAERPVVSKMVGHGKESTTENYYKVNILEVIEGTKSADFEALNI